MFNFIGAIIGDIIGSKYEFNNIRTKEFDLFTNDMFFTDDTVMTLAIADSMINKKDIVKTMQLWGKKYPYCSWGCSFSWWLKQDNPEPYYSFGNGAAMRVSPIGWIARSEKEVEELSYKVTSLSHDHPEGIKGAYVTAMCVYYARIGKSKEFIKEFVKKYYFVDFDYEMLIANYFFDESCQNTVPQAIYCFLISKNFEDCLRTSISIGGDSDTLAAISCSIAGAFYGIPNNFVIKTFEYLDENMQDLINNFEFYLQNHNN